jgi:hypothetical protein
MKKRERRIKLVVQRETIRILEQPNLARVNGGVEALAGDNDSRTCVQMALAQLH